MISMIQFPEKLIKIAKIKFDIKDLFRTPF